MRNLLGTSVPLVPIGGRVARIGGLAYLETGQSVAAFSSGACLSMLVMAAGIAADGVGVWTV